MMLGCLVLLGPPESVCCTHTPKQLLCSTEAKQGEKRSQTEKLAGSGCSSRVEHSPSTQEVLHLILSSIK